MISPDRMLSLLLDASPGFAPLWDEFKECWASETERPPYYLALADFAQHLSATALASGDDATLRRVFAVVEQLLLEGDPYVQEAATVGLLEDLQNTNLHEGTHPDQYLPYLQPESRRWWDKVTAFWERGELLRDD